MTLKRCMLAPEQGRKTVSILSEGFCEKQAHPYLLSKGKFGFNAS